MLQRQRDHADGSNGTVVALSNGMSPAALPIELPDGVSRDYLLYHRVCPLGVEADGAISVATAPDARREALTELGFAFGREVRDVPSTTDSVERAIERVANARERSIELASDADHPDDFAADVRDLANQAPVVRFVNLLVREAVDARASDIHLEASRSGLVVRFRLDGVLVDALEPPSEHHHAIVSRIKLLAELDIAERRRPQDGRIRVRLPAGELDLRVSTVPTIHGESVVLRLLDRGGRPVSLEELGAPSDLLPTLQRIATRPHGMLLAAGPTGSGKSTTLYAALHARDRKAEKIVTVEDPVEFHLPGITQVPVHRQIGVTFANVLRSLLRQDPDVLLIGEMRDAETAEIGVQAAMTGHFVFSTVHTQDALGSVARLTDLGVPAYMIAASVEAVVGQRLMRRVCDACRVAYRPSAAACSAASGRPSASIEGSRGVGCPACRGTGYRGRVGVFELLQFTEPFKDIIVRGGSRRELNECAAADGMRTMRDEAWSKVVAGVTTVEEVHRVLA